MLQKFNPKYPSVSDLRTKAKMKMPKFAFEYLDGCCNYDHNLRKNTSDLRAVELVPEYLKSSVEVSLKTKLFGTEYDAPFGIAPIGLQGLMWPNAPEILAKAAFENNLPFILSTVTTSSIEKIGKITEGKAWFQLYYPSKEEVEKWGGKGVFMGYYFKWNNQENLKIIESVGFKRKQGRIEISYTDHEKLDCLYMNLHDYLKYLKYGYFEMFLERSHYIFLTIHLNLSSDRRYGS